jgi:peptide methionine sulfoxide reductase MsrB
VDGQPSLMVCVCRLCGGLNGHLEMIAIPGAVSRHVDNSFGAVRTEITCTACGGHLGHVFKGEGFNTPSKHEHCLKGRN